MAKRAKQVPCAAEISFFSYSQWQFNGHFVTVYATLAGFIEPASYDTLASFFAVWPGLVLFASISLAFARPHNRYSVFPHCPIVAN